MRAAHHSARAAALMTCGPCRHAAAMAAALSNIGAKVGGWGGGLGWTAGWLRGAGDDSRRAAAMAAALSHMGQRWVGNTWRGGGGGVWLSTAVVQQQ